MNCETCGHNYGMLDLPLVPHNVEECRMILRAERDFLKLQNEEYRKALEKIAAVDPRYPDGEAMSDEMCAKIALGRNCYACGSTLPCREHKERQSQKPKSERSPYAPNLDYPRKPVIEKQIREGDGHICIAAEEVPCSLCGRVTEKRNDEGQVCDSCGWNNGPNHGGGSRVMYAVGKVTKCGSCLPTTR